MATLVKGQVIAPLQAQWASLTSRLATAQAQGDTGLVKVLQDGIDSTTQALAQGLSDYRQAITDSAQAGIDAATKGETRLQTTQALAGTAGTVGGDRQMADYIRDSVVAPLQAQLSGPGGLYSQLAAAQRVGDAGTVSAIQDAIDSVGQTIAQATGDMKSALEDAAQKLSDAAQSIVDNASQGLDLLTSAQNLAAEPGGAGALASANAALGQIPGLPSDVQAAGTPQGGAQLGRYIQDVILPAVAAKVATDRRNYQDALSRGDTDAAAQYLKQMRDDARAYYDDSKQALDDINGNTAQTAANTADLTGTEGFSFQNQQFTDALAVGVGA
jgi:hypothetical protein